MIPLFELTDYCNRLLSVSDYQDYCPNGLQVEGRPQVSRLISGVTASLELLERAADVNADAILVHHGYFWRGEAPEITGIKQRRLRMLLSRDISLIAYHLPLDGHPELGNNAQFGQRLGFSVEGRFGLGPEGGLAMFGPSSLASADELSAHLQRCLNRAPLHVGGGERPIQRIGWCTGAAQDYIEHAAALGLDAFISGEISERTVHLARELGVHYFAAGHHATERYGVQALGAHLAERFDLDHEFMEIPNPA